MAKDLQKWQNSSEFPNWWTFLDKKLLIELLHNLLPFSSSIIFQKLNNIQKTYFLTFLSIFVCIFIRIFKNFPQTSRILTQTIPTLQHSLIKIPTSILNDHRTYQNQINRNDKHFTVNINSTIRVKLCRRNDMMFKEV